MFGGLYNVSNTFPMLLPNIDVFGQLRSANIQYTYQFRCIKPECINENLIIYVQLNEQQYISAAFYRST